MVNPSEVTEKLEAGCYVRGLYLEGAAWDLEKSELASSSQSSCPRTALLQVIPIEVSRLKLQGTFKTPVYVTQKRRNAMGVGLVLSADLSTSQHASHWVSKASLSLNIDS